tara:strand:- start:777 stop:890 length:114 start_codon:yes stop_codon:yes gene_type:complete
MVQASLLVHRLDEVGTLTALAKIRVHRERVSELSVSG